MLFRSYNANGGTIQLNLPPNTPGGEIQTDAANITLSGASAAINDLSGNNALALNTINSNASLTLLNGNAMTTPGSLTSAGAVTVGTGSTLTTTGTGGYTQTGGTTKVDGMLSAGGGIGTIASRAGRSPAPARSWHPSRPSPAWAPSTPAIPGLEPSTSLAIIARAWAALFLRTLPEPVLASMA